MSSKRMEPTRQLLERTFAASTRRYGPCLHPRCHREGKNRGLCNSHASRMWVLIEEGRLTEAEAIAHGKMLPVQRDFTEWALDWKGACK